MNPAYTRIRKAEIERAVRVAPVLATESEEQSSVVAWWGYQSARLGLDARLLFSIPNGANKGYAQAAKFKREGLRAGIPDLMLAIPKAEWHGLFIEMKSLAKSAKVQPMQLECQAMLARQGYKVATCRGSGEAIDVIREYLVI